jgi:nucleotide-binding universal stress UspA family protein
MQIVAATDFSNRAQRAVRRAGLLAHDTSASLTLLHVVDDDRPPDLVALERREAERYLREQVTTIGELHGVEARVSVVQADPFDGILRASAETGADLVVMGTHRKQVLRDIFIGTTIERVIREASCPVLMVNREVGVPYRTALAAVDMSAWSLNAVRTSIALGLPSGAGLTLIYAFEPLAKDKMVLAGLRQDTIADYVADERKRAHQEMVAFLSGNGLEAYRASTRIEEGAAIEVITRTVAETRPDVLVMGTKGRTWLARALLGSVTEAVLRSLDVDILAVPPRR